MIKVLIPSDAEFRCYEIPLKKMYENLQNKICDNNTFENILNQTFFYAFLSKNNNEKDVLLGAIYYFKIKDKLFVNSFSVRKYFFERLSCLKTSLDWFNCDIYAEAQNKASIFCLLKCGFKRLEGNFFVFRRKKELCSGKENYVI